MARARLLKPGFFTNELLAELPFEGRLLFAGLWTLADKEGRLEDRPRRIQASLFPWDVVDVHALLDALATKGFIDRYTVTGMPLIQIAKFTEHQTPHQRETPSILPGPHEPRKGDASTSPRFPVLVAVSDPVSGNGSNSPEALPRSVPPSPYLTFPTQGKPELWVLTVAQVEEWQGLYPGLVIHAECRQALAWLQANPGRKKTAGGMPKFLVNWFNRATDHRVSSDRRDEPRGSQDRRLGHSARYVVPCPHAPSCANTATCCRKQDAEAV